MQTLGALVSAPSALVSSPSACLATIVMILVAIEAHYLLYMALRRRKSLTRKSLGLRRSKVRRKEVHVPEELSKVFPNLPKFKDLETENLLQKPSCDTTAPKSISLLPLPLPLPDDFTGKLHSNVKSLAMVPMERMCSAEERLGGAIQTAMDVLDIFSIHQRAQKSKMQIPVKPLEVIRNLQNPAKVEQSEAVFGCATVHGTRVTLIEQPTDTSCMPGPLVMPSKADDDQTKSLIGKARKVHRRCAECTRPLPAHEDQNVFVCSRCSASGTSKEKRKQSKRKSARRSNAESQKNDHFSTNRKVQLLDDSTDGWESVKTRRRRRSEKQRSSGGSNKNNSRRNHIR